MALNPKYPTIEHEQAAETIVHFFVAFPVTETISNKKTGFKD